MEANSSPPKSLVTFSLVLVLVVVVAAAAAISILGIQKFV
jgi:hypothetical protein